MDTLHEVLKFNEEFVANKEYVPYETTGLPDKKIVILSCMDTRLVELLPRAMNLKNGDVKIVKNAGAVVSHPFGSIMRSILVAVYELQAEEVWVIGHHDCGMGKVDPDALLHKMEDSVTKEVVSSMKHVGIDLHSWLQGFTTVQDGVRGSVSMIENHPLLPKDLPVHGLVIDPATGKLDRVTE
ncbi:MULTISPECIES: beta-class carbonic anhydrase [Bacillales]|uniref:beta-class carbonic anhydrase n=1 Tax=Bacillales TaxID=1385 RepID=UPI0018844DA4|nr:MULTISPECIES: carbonic anhydrase [Bacillaceae]MBF0705126.1 carbonic anhydrase [Pseudalkalibacillus hwajinpoensis]MDO6656383.1 carbonic anhydrase [Anaerobacillus sp. 1_MG-2023]WLR57845.1 carbonic anhydrase [Pseudalkalibacillus hwajinpoensis]